MSQSTRFILPKSNGSVNGLVWVAVQNLSDTPAQEVEFEYSEDSFIWNELVFDESKPPRDYDRTGRTYQGFCNTESLASGQYWLRVTMTDTVHSLERSETIPVVIDKNPITVINVSYDTLTGTVTFDASSSYDPEGCVIWWEWIFCDTSTYQGSVIQKDFVPGDSCQVNLTVYDDVYNSSTSYNMLVVYYDTISFEELDYCICAALDVYDSGRIPDDSRLNFGQTNSPHPKGGKVLGPVDHHEQDAGGNKIALGEISLYFMVEALVLGNPEACSTMQYNNITLLYDGPGGDGPNGMKVTHSRGKPFDPANPNNPQNPPANAADLDPDDYNTDCTPDRPPRKRNVFEKISLRDNHFGLLWGVIRWIDAPGDPAARATDFRPSGYQMFDFKEFLVIDYSACNTGCKKCIVWKAKYGEDKKRQDVDGDGNVDPPKITDPNANCP